MSLFSDNFRFLYDYTRTQVPELNVDVWCPTDELNADLKFVGLRSLPLDERGKNYGASARI